MDDRLVLYHRNFVDVTDKATTRGPAQDPVAVGQTREAMEGSYQGYQAVASSLRTLDLYPKPGQDFEKCATQWEKLHSTLVPGSGPTRLKPVVHVKAGAAGFPVVAHHGEIGQGEILVPRQYKGQDSPADLLNQDVPLFVVNRGYPDAGDWAPLSNGRTMYRHTVITDLEGRILAELDRRTVDGLEEADPFLYLDIAMLLVELGAAVGRRLVQAMTRRAARKEAANAIKSLQKAKLELRMPKPRSIPRSSGYVRKSGITPEHFRSFQEAAREAKVIAVVRNGKESAIPLIEKGCPGKPKVFEPFNTDPRTGILTAKSEADKALVYRNNYILVNEQRVPLRRLTNGSLERVEIPHPFWELEPGQVIDPALKKPIVGDYDLMGVFEESNTGQNITLATSNGVPLANRTSPVVDRFTNTINRKFDQKRILHGAQDQYKGFRGGATAFFPDGSVLYMDTEAEVEQFYATIKRQPITGSYPKPRADVHVPDELAARRTR